MPQQPFPFEPEKPTQIQPTRLRPPKTNDTQYVNDYPDWGNIPPPGSMLPANPKTLASGMPFLGKPTNGDYGDFKGLNEKPIKVEPEKGQKNPLGVDLPFLGATTYDNHFKPYQVGPGNGEPQLDPVSLSNTGQ